jgi:CubicO group peptidase (beta-lactamase class C family)
MRRGAERTKLWSIEQRLTAHEVPGAAVAIIDNGEIVWAKGYGTALAGSEIEVDVQTVFSVGSISKLVNAALILRLVAEKKIDLDIDVNTYLKSWKIPENSFSKVNKVTLRSILSHTSGFSQHGFDDYLPGDKLPTALETLNGIEPAKNDPVRLVFSPSQEMRYSGGGITVSQVIVEDITGLSYNDAANKYVFEPLGMNRSTFINPLPNDYGNVAKSHDEYGEPTALPRGWEAMPEMAASGLWTNVLDVSQFIIALMKSLTCESDFLPPEIAKDMMTRVENSWHGLGPRLNGNNETQVFHHGGANDSYRAWVEGHPQNKSGIVIFTNGTDGHWIHKEMRKSAEDEFCWSVKSDGGFEEPEL